MFIHEIFMNETLSLVDFFDFLFSQWPIRKVVFVILIFNMKLNSSELSLNIHSLFYSSCNLFKRVATQSIQESEVEH